MKAVDNENFWIENNLQNCSAIAAIAPNPIFTVRNFYTLYHIAERVGNRAIDIVLIQSRPSFLNL